MALFVLGSTGEARWPGVAAGVPPGPPRLTIQGHRRTAWSGPAAGKPRSPWHLKRSTSPDGFVSLTFSCRLDLETVPTVTFDPEPANAGSQATRQTLPADAISFQNPTLRKRRGQVQEGRIVRSGGKRMAIAVPRTSSLSNSRVPPCNSVKDLASGGPSPVSDQRTTSQVFPMTHPRRG